MGMDKRITIGFFLKPTQNESKIDLKRSGFIPSMIHDMVLLRHAFMIKLVVL
jgi:hypothetical protein